MELKGRNSVSVSQWSETRVTGIEVPDFSQCFLCTK